MFLLMGLNIGMKKHRKLQNHLMSTDELKRKRTGIGSLPLSKPPSVGILF